MITGSADICAVFVPNSPNPITGRLCFVPLRELTFVAMTPKEGLKLVISTGSYLPEKLGLSLRP